MAGELAGQWWEGVVDGTHAANEGALAITGHNLAWLAGVTALAVGALLAGKYVVNKITG